MLYNGKNDFREENVPSRAKKTNKQKKKTTKYWHKTFKHLVLFGTCKNCIGKLSTKMLKKPNALKVDAYQMLLSFKTSLAYNIFLTSRRTTVSVVKQPLSDITRFFARLCPMFGAIFRLGFHKLTRYMFLLVAFHLPIILQ